MMRLLTLLLFLIVVVGSVAPAMSQPQAEDNKQQTDVFGDIGRWIERSFGSVGGELKNAGHGIDKGISNFNREAGVAAKTAAKTTADAAVDAADAVTKLPKTRVVSGRQNCPVSENGAPDCVAAANKLCQSRGLKTGNSLDVTSARECPLRRITERHKPRECKNVTFITRAVCQ